MRPIIITYMVLFAVLNFAFVLPKYSMFNYQKTISWEQDTPLTWNDFAGQSKNWSNIGALTASAIEYAYECQEGHLDIDVKAIFIPEESWAKSEAMTDHILDHEQLHFNITEIYARKLREQFTKEVNSCNDIYKIESIAEIIINEWKHEQEKYDADSKHSIDREMQSLWGEKVEADLISTHDFALVEDDLNN